MGERCTVEGTVQHVIFQNEENGYTVLGLLTEEGELVTVVGCIPCVAPGEKLTADGLWVSHPSYGQQFAAETVERLMPETEEELISYLSSGIIKGVGPATAERLVERFGGETLAVIEEEPERLSTVKGITSKRAMEISAASRELSPDSGASYGGTGPVADFRALRNGSERAIPPARGTPCCGG